MGEILGNKIRSAKKDTPHRPRKGVWTRRSRTLGSGRRGKLGERGGKGPLGEKEKPSSSAKANQELTRLPKGGKVSFRTVGETGGPSKFQGRWPRRPGLAGGCKKEFEGGGHRGIIDRKNRKSTIRTGHE